MNKTAWDNLSIHDKSRYIKLALDSGVSDLKQVRDSYNLYAKGGIIAHRHAGDQPTDTSDLNTETDQTTQRPTYWVEPFSSGVFGPQASQYTVQQTNPYFAISTKEQLAKAEEVAKEIDNPGYFDSKYKGERMVLGKPLSIVEQNPGLTPFFESDLGYNIASIIPVAGDALQAGEAINAAKNGNIAEAAVLGSLLLVPNVLEKAGTRVLKHYSKENIEKVNREFIKQINKQTKRYGYKPLDLNISKQGTEAVNKQVQERLLDMNTFSRGVYTIKDDVLSSAMELPTGINRYDVNNALMLNKRLMALGIEPTAENRLKYSLNHLAGNTGHGRAGVNNKTYTLYTSNDFGKPTSTAERYSQASVNGGDFRDYYDSLVGILQRPIEFGPDRSKWFIQSEYPIFPSESYMGANIENVFSNLDSAKAYFNGRNRFELVRLASFIDNINGGTTPEYRELLRAYYNPYDKEGVFKNTYSRLITNITTDRNNSLHRIYALANKNNVKIPKKKINIGNYSTIENALLEIERLGQANPQSSVIKELKKDIYRTLATSDKQRKAAIFNQAKSAVRKNAQDFSDIQNYIFEHQLKDFINYSKEYGWLQTPIILDSAVPMYKYVKGMDPQYAHFIFTGSQEGLQPINIINSYVPTNKSEIPTTRRHFGTNTQINRHSREIGGYLFREGGDSQRPFPYKDPGTITQGKAPILDQLESVYNSPIVSALKVFDPTGISGYPDLFFDARYFYNTPSSQRTDGDYLILGTDLLGALPFVNTLKDFATIAKLTKSFRGRSAIKLLDTMSKRLPGFIADLSQSDSYKKYHQMLDESNLASRKYREGGNTNVSETTQHFIDSINGTNYPEFWERLKADTIRTIPDWTKRDSVASHRMSYADGDGGYYIFPNVQNVNGNLIDFSRPSYDYWAGYDNAMQSGDYIYVPDRNVAESFTTEYKNSDSFPAFKAFIKDNGGYLQNLTTKPFSYQPIPAVRYDEGGFMTRLKELLGISSDTTSNANDTTGKIDWGEIAQRQAYAESKYASDKTSRAGARGMYQIMLPVMEDYNNAMGTNIDATQLYNDTINTDLRNWYMQNLMNRTWINKDNSTDSVKVGKALAAYNYGPGNTLKALNKAKGNGVDIYNGWEWLNSFPQETQDYVNFILRNQNNSLTRNDFIYNIIKGANKGKSELISSKTKK